jgi:Lysyl oxidase/Bacterial Ig domain
MLLLLVAIAVAAVFGALALTGGLGSARASGATPQLPDLVSEPPTGPELTASSEGGINRFLLRFNGYVHNKGLGALDMRGSREAPNVSAATTKEVEQAHTKTENLPVKTEEELSRPAMKVTQRMFLPRSGKTEEEPGALEDEHVEELSAGEMVYSSADGHHHWHLQHVAKYGLWNAARSAEAVPSQKVGFCLEDSERRENTGPEKAVYEDKVRGNFCQAYWPNATTLTEGISPGWRDRYLSNLAFQWVDISNVAPGEYWLGEEVNPDKFVKETEPSNTVAFAEKKTIVPGFNAQAQSAATPYEHSMALTLTASEYSAPPGFKVSPSEAVYEQVTGPAHGKVTGFPGSHVTYTPEAGYSGSDSFTFRTRDEHSEFPRNPTVATVSIGVGEAPLPALSITSAPGGMTAGTSATVSAEPANSNEAVQWTVSAGTISPEPPLGHTATFTAPASPPPGGSVTVTAKLASGFTAERMISISPVPAATPAPELPLAKTGVAGTNTAKPVYLTRPLAMLRGRELVISTVPALAGRVQLAAYLGKHLLGRCRAQTPANRRFTCHLHLGSLRVAREKISIDASLRANGSLLTAALPAERIPRMTMTPIGKLHGSARAAAASASIFWCSPGTMEETLLGGEE